MTGQQPAPAIPAPPAPPAPPTLFQGADLGSMQAQVGELRIQLAGLRAQWKGLRVQLDNMLQTNPARPGVQQQWADVGVQIAKVEGDVATLQARIALKEGVLPGVPGMPVIPRMPSTVGIAGPAITALVVLLIFPVSIAWAKRILRGTPKPAPASTDVSMRLERMEQAIDTIAIEVERISEGQRFVTKIMTERSARAAEGMSADASQAKQPLALGAGAMEPIVVSEREHVRQRIVTPH